MFTHKKNRTKTIIIAVVLLAGLSVGVIVLLNSRKAKAPTVEQVVTNNETIQQKNETKDSVEPKPTQAVESETAKVEYPVTLTYDQAKEIDVVVNKKHRLPQEYAPELTNIRGSQLRPEAAKALEELMMAAEDEGLNPTIISGYRSYTMQINTYSNYVAQNGRDKADTFSARPGHSEHQTGLAVDLGNSDGTCDLEICFAKTKLGEWLKTNAHKTGFIIRYQENKDAQTGYQYEPWHLRYVGTELASKIYESGKTMDEYLGIEAGGY